MSDIEDLALIHGLKILSDRQKLGARNTVFSQTTEVAVKAPDVETVEVVVAPVRCDEGKRLIHEWATAVKNENDREKCLILFFSHGEYSGHLKTCEQCRDYEKRRWHP